MTAFIAIFALAIIFGAVILLQRRKRNTTAQWPATRGRILSAQIYRQSSSDDISASEPIIWYEYAVNGSTYRSKRVKYGFTPKAPQTIARYPVGLEVNVFYDPANPGTAVLER